ncbi:hypothetical protein [Streptomyces sp. NPDC007088]|uniref:hypothetical protein n=1 Tax=Streptomyces sp. NPDC007088 TaxID=3364773 RepID=UPI0036924603
MTEAGVEHATEPLTTADGTGGPGRHRGPASSQQGEGAARQSHGRHRKPVEAAGREQGATREQAAA